MIGKLWCEHGSWESINPETKRLIADLESKLGRSMSSNSGYRCPDCNRAVGGAQNSAHIRGQAFDINCDSDKDRAELIEAVIFLRPMDFRIGIAKTFVHIDTGRAEDGYNSPRLWVY